ncbi:phage tail protein [Yersinia intermedia]|uniref:phage tail protein n=1 Tax=Yersinia intermedia TaxID=631 RepID=UPI000A428EC7
MKCNGSVFNKTQFPQLALVYPSGYLPDLRGMFIRGWDDGRNVDAGRELGSEQLSDNKSHNHNLITWGVTHTGLGGSDVSIPAPPGGTPNGGTGLGTVPTQTLTGGSGSTYIATSAITASGGSESRPRNIAFNYIVRSA